MAHEDDSQLRSKTMLRVTAANAAIYCHSHCLKTILLPIRSKLLHKGTNAQQVFTMHMYGESQKTGLRRFCNDHSLHGAQNAAMTMSTTIHKAMKLRQTTPLWAGRTNKHRINQGTINAISDNRGQPSIASIGECTSRNHWDGPLLF